MTVNFRNYYFYYFLGFQSGGFVRRFAIKLEGPVLGKERERCRTDLLLGRFMDRHASGMYKCSMCSVFHWLVHLFWIFPDQQ